MRFNKLKLDNWCQHKELTLEFHPGLNGIVGRNGSGKSNILRALKRVLRGSDAAAIGTKDQDLTWGEQTGSLVLHFTHDGQEGILKRSIKSSAASLTWCGEKYKTLPEITEKLNAILGVGGKVLDNIVFVDQGAIESVIFSRPAERAKTLYALLGLDNAEKIREYLGERLQTLFVQPIEEERARLAARRNELEEQIHEVLKRIDYARISIKHTDKECEEMQTKVFYAEQYSKIAEEAQKAKSDLSVLEVKLQSAQSELKESQAHQDELEAVLGDAELVNAYQSAKVRTANAEQNRIKHEEFLNAQSRLSQIEIQRSQLKPPKPASITQADINSMHSALVTAKTQFNQIPTFDSRLKDQAHCPLCRQTLPMDELKALTKRRDLLAVEISKLDGKYQSAVALLNAIQRESEAYTAAQNKLAKDEARCRAIVDCGDVIVDSQDDEETITAFEAAQANLKQWQKKLNSAKELVANYSAGKAAILQRITKIDGMEKPLSPKEIQEFRQTISDCTAAKSELAVAEALVASYRADIAKTIAEHDALMKRAELQKNVSSCRELFERARGLLHRDQLPNLAAQKFIAAINVGMNRHLELFDADFSAEMHPDLSFSFRQGEKSPAPVDRLSGGQKVALSLALRFAFHDLFAAKMGLLILDEPSIFLDKERIDALAELLERVKASACERGLQMLVVTHEERLCKVFDNVFEL